MKNKLILILILIMSVSNIKAQNGSVNAMGLTIYLPENFDYSENVKNILENKLRQLVTKQGFSPVESRFVITAKLDVLSKNAVASFKPKYSYDIGLNLYIGDGVEGRSFSSYYTELSGTGYSEKTALRNAIKKLNVNNRNLDHFVNEAKERIMAYYRANCENIIEESQLQFELGHRDDAIRGLLNIPQSVSGCWKKSAELAVNMYTKKQNIECAQTLSEAKGRYASNPNSNGANSAMNVLLSISPQASCFNEVKKFQSEIASKVEADKLREWDLKVKKEYELQKDLIQAYRDIEVQRHTKRDIYSTIIYKSLY